MRLSERGGGFDNLQLFVWVNIIISCIYGYFLENWGYIYQINESLKDFIDESYKKKKESALIWLKLVMLWYPKHAFAIIACLFLVKAVILALAENLCNFLA